LDGLLGVVVYMAFDRFPILYESLSVGPEMSVTAKKMKTKLLTSLSRKVDATFETIIGREVPIGTIAYIGGTLYDEADKTIAGKTINIYHRVGTGTWAKTEVATTDQYGHFSVTYNLSTPGIQSFYCEFPGDDSYEGCAKTSFAKSR